MAEPLEKKEEIKKKPEEEKLEPEVELDDDGNPIEKKEPWQAVEKEEGGLDDVPALTHIKIKQKLKGRISDRDEEIEKLKAENAQLKTKPGILDTKTFKRPAEADYEETEDYHAALDEYETKAAKKRYDLLDQQNRQTTAQTQAKERLEKTVTEHYERAGQLIETSGIESDVYKKADQTVREAIEAVIPDMGDIVADQIISMVGEGSEKVIYYLGRNRGALNEFRALLSEDKSGMRAAIYLGQQKERLTTPKKQTTKVLAPIDEVTGDAVPNGNERKYRKTYDTAHKKNDAQAAYNAKKAAKAAGVNVSGW